LGLVLRKYEQMGITVEREGNGVTVSRTRDLVPVDIQTLPFPGFPTDMQAQTMCLLSVANGTCIVTENVFENRFIFASELQRMGSNIDIQGHHAVVHGVEGLSGAEVRSPDLRGGAALVMAGLIADGVTTVSDIHHIDRGYERFVEKLRALGAHISRVTIPTPEFDFGLT
jgi:UDP-N-acetylglucosamine 1-carboxyvinyltransferase